MEDANRNGVADVLERNVAPQTGPPTAAGARPPATGGGTPAPARDPDAMRGEDPYIHSVSPADMKSFQLFLQQAGFNPGPIDGIFGPKTLAAMQAFQRANELPVTSTYDRATEQAVMRMAMQGGSSVGGPGTGVAAVEPGGATPTPAQAVATAATPVSDSDAEARIRQLYPQFVAYLDHPELGPILRQAAELGWGATELQGAIYNTNYWKNTPSSARAWEQQHATDPATATQRLLSQVATVINISGQMGYEFDGNTNLMLADQAIRYGWDQDQLNAAVTAQVRKTYGEGKAPLNAGTIKNLADQLWAQSREFLVPVSRKTVEGWALDIQSGKKSQEGFTAWVTGLSKGRFPWLTKEIESGNTPERYFSSHQQRIAQILEISPDEIDWMDKQWGGIIDFNDPAGNRRSMSLSEVDDWARRNPRYRYTQQANEKGYNIINGLLRDLGEFA